MVKKGYFLTMVSLCVCLMATTIILGFRKKHIECKYNELCNSVSPLVSTTDVKILLGDTAEYLRCNAKYVSGRMCEKNYLLYSFIMADKYCYNFAAQQFANILVCNQDVDMDSTLTSFLLHYLKLATEGNDEKQCISKAMAAFQIANWCRGGNKNVALDDSMALFYDSVGQSAIKQTEK